MSPTGRRGRPRLLWAAALSAAAVVSATVVAQASQGADDPAAVEYTLTSACRGLALTAPGAQDAVVRLTRADQGAQAQRWHVSATDGGFVTVASAVDGRVVDVAREATATGSPVIVWPSHQGLNQQWRVTDAGDGTSTLEPRNAAGTVLGLGRGRTVQLAAPGDGCWTHWRLTRVTGAAPAPGPGTGTPTATASPTPSSSPTAGATTAPPTTAAPSTTRPATPPPSTTTAPAPSTSTTSAPPPAAPPTVNTSPVLDRDFADPDVVKAGDVYHAYATNSNGKHIQQATSRDLASWSYQQADALPTLGAWANPGCGGCVWAPDVSAAGNGYLMYYVARDRASDKQCIGAATSPTPDGPFTPAGTRPIVCTPDQGGSIDPSSFVDGGHRYIVWKNDGNCCAMDDWLHVQEVSADGLTVTGPDTRLVKQDRPFEGAVVEAPVIWKHGSTYVLVYAANNYADDSYATGYATSTSITGPYTKGAMPLMTTGAFHGAIRGPGGADVVVGPDGADRVVLHGWDAAHRYRALYVEGLTWDGDTPVVAGTR